MPPPASATAQQPPQRTGIPGTQCWRSLAVHSRCRPATHGRRWGGTTNSPREPIPKNGGSPGKSSPREGGKGSPSKTGTPRTATSAAAGVQPGWPPRSAPPGPSRPPPAPRPSTARRWDICRATAGGGGGVGGAEEPTARQEKKREENLLPRHPQAIRKQLFGDGGEKSGNML